MNDVCKRVALEIQQDLKSVNDSPYRDTLLVKMQLLLYNACQELIDCVDNGDDAEKLLTKKMKAESKRFTEWLNNSDQKENQEIPFSPWHDIGLQLMVEIRIAKGELTEEDVRKAYDDAFRKMESDTN